MTLYHIRLVPYLDADSAYIFPVTSFTLSEGSFIKIGRAADNQNPSNFMAFKSKVVSRHHAVIWVQKGNICIKDTQSSSGTFVNGRQLLLSNGYSNGSKLKHNDIVQLGIDYHKGYLDVHKCVKMKIEINKDSKPTQYNIQTFQKVREFVLSKQDHNNIQIDECCICLYTIAPKQALFISPCAHSFHFRCIYQLLNKKHPGFTCPLCRGCFDLDLY
ncbi:hypothetical protein K501DRAFT_243243 [Backusella circina FSU 941]|nr:hypothetical protein K501DRAFT_243243 [Backusella circina FSU 941]